MELDAGCMQRQPAPLPIIFSPLCARTHHTLFFCFAQSDKEGTPEARAG